MCYALPLKADSSAALATAPRQPVVWPLSMPPDWLLSLASQQQPLSGFRQMVNERKLRGWGPQTVSAHNPHVLARTPLGFLLYTLGWVCRDSR